jgi:hypothetical protein
MYFSAKALLVASLVAAPVVAMAETPPASAPVVKVGKMLASSDGRRLGRIDQLDKAKDGTLVTAELFSDMGILYIPVSSISASGDSKLVTSLSYAEVTKGK